MSDSSASPYQQETKGGRSPRVERQWQHASNWLTLEEGERRRTPLISLSSLVASAYTLVMILHNGNLQVYPRTLEEDARFRVIPRLLANACRVAKETVPLLSAGYPKGPIGRWRTLYEVSLVITLIVAGKRRRGQQVVVSEARQLFLNDPFRNDRFNCPQRQTLAFLRIQHFNGVPLRLHRAAGPVGQACPALRAYAKAFNLRTLWKVWSALPSYSNSSHGPEYIVPSREPSR